MHASPANAPDVIALLTRLVSIQSLSRDEFCIANFLESWLRDHGLSVRRIDDNVICEIHGDAPGPTFLLNSHLDTVPACDGWLSDPWSPFILESPDLRDNERPGPRLVGLGSGDAKASVAAMACAAVQVFRQGLRRGKLMFVASVMEEIGKGGMDTIRPQLGHIDAGMIGEPTSLQAATSQSGLMVLECCAKGRASHAARSHLGVNAITIAARDLLKIADWKFDRLHPQLGPTMVNATVIKGGDRHNVIPDRCEFTLDIRTTPAYTHEDIVELLREKLESEINVRSLRLRSVETPLDGRLLKSLQNAYLSVFDSAGRCPDPPKALPLETAGLCPEPAGSKRLPDPAELRYRNLVQFGSPTMSDWAHLRDMEGVKYGPGDSPRSHTANESVNISEVIAAVDIYARTASLYISEH